MIVRSLQMPFDRRAGAALADPPTASHPASSEEATDRYRGFADLAADAVRGIDYDIVVRRRARDSGVVLAAPHGGGIETGTSELAAAIAGHDHPLYAFEGLRPGGNDALHVTSTRFDEPVALGLISAADATVTVHGCRGRRARVYVGGLNTALAARVRACLAAAGFPLAEPPRGLEGRTPTNLTNRARHAGVQLELSAPLRAQLISGEAGHGADRLRLCRPGVVFAAAVRSAVRAWQAEPAPGPLTPLTPPGRAPAPAS